jgi:hypothetical protein
MTLSEILNPITSDDVRAGYDFKLHLPNSQFAIDLGLSTRITLIGERNDSSPHVLLRYEIIDSNELSFTDFPTLRKFYYNEVLLSDIDTDDLPSGKVVYNGLFFLKKEYQKKGIATLIYTIEEILYRKWQAIQIQLTATNDGKIVWRKKGFILPYSEILSLEARYEQWCLDNGKKYFELKNISLFPEEFLLSTSVKQISMFKVL